MISPEKLEALKLETLFHFWGYQNFRDSQSEIIDSVLNARDTLILLPTGGGKSLCYQLPALLLDGTCLVVSPLVALMKDQVNALRENYIEADFLSAELEDSETEEILSRCQEGLTKLLYVSPERLLNPFFLENIREVKLSFIAVDEAHCISEWGQDFRPGYRNIRNFRENFSGLPCIALTATATEKVLEEINTQLNLKNAAIFRQSFRRSNISISTDEVSDKFQRVLDLLKNNNSSGIIYTRTRKDAEGLTEFLQNKNLRNVEYFHAGLPPKEKTRRQLRWQQSDQQVLVATNAFGMGIDKDNVRFVIHLSPASSLENYYQEIGRAGRDAHHSTAFLLWNRTELQEFDDILKNQIPSKAEFIKIVTFLYSLFQVGDGDLVENTFQLKLQRLKTATGLSSAKISNVLTFLHNQEIIYYNLNAGLSTLKMNLRPDELDQLPAKDSYFVELLFRTIPGLTANKVSFSEQQAGKKMDVEPRMLKERLRDLERAGTADYIDGCEASVKFLKPRNDHYISGQYWHLFRTIQQNKVAKWEEMKFFTTETQYCRMKLILLYFGEKNVKNCGRCSSCQKTAFSFGQKTVENEIVKILRERPASADEIALKLQFTQRETVLENLILLLDEGKVKMVDFRTYTLA